jgi:microcystin-dependent protein
MGYSTIDVAGGAGSAGSRLTVSQPNNFAIGSAIRLDSSGTYVKALADTSENAEVIGVVENRTPTEFTVIFNGVVKLSGITLTKGAVYFLSSVTPGQCTVDVTPPLKTGTIRKSVLIGASNNRAIVVNYIGLKNGIGGHDLVELDGVQPVGTIIPYGGDVHNISLIPKGWLLCDGSQFSSSTYPDLGLLLGDTHGPVNGTMHYLPDFRGRTPVGVNITNSAMTQNITLSQRVVGTASGTEEHPLTYNEMPSHNHSSTYIAYKDDASNPSDEWFANRIGGITYGACNQCTSTSGEISGSATVPISDDGPILGSEWYNWDSSGDDDDYGKVNYPNTVNNAGGGVAHNNMQPYVVVNWLIRANPQVSAAILTVNLQDLADVDTTKSCGASCEGECNAPSIGDSLVYNSANKFSVTATNRADKNVIINGNFDVWSRATSTTSDDTTNGRLFASDRFFYSRSSALSAKQDIKRSTNSHPFRTGISSLPGVNTLQVLTTTIQSSLSPTDYINVGYNVEGYDFRPLWGAKCMTLSFYVKCNKTGTYSVSFRNEDRDKSYVSSYTIEAINTWERKTITVPIPSHHNVAEWNFEALSGLRIGWSLASGSSWQVTALQENTWVDGNATSVSTQTNSASTADGVNPCFELAEVQLEAGSVATPFQQMRIEDEISRCERYYENSYESGILPGTVTTRGAVVGSDWQIDPLANVNASWRTRKRTRPAVTIWNPALVNTSSSFTMISYETGTDINHTVNAVVASDTDIYSIQKNTATTVVDSYKNKLAFHYEADAELN